MQHLEGVDAWAARDLHAWVMGGAEVGRGSLGAVGAAGQRHQQYHQQQKQQQVVAESLQCVTWQRKWQCTTLYRARDAGIVIT